MYTYNVHREPWHKQTDGDATDWLLHNRMVKLSYICFWLPVFSDGQIAIVIQFAIWIYLAIRFEVFDLKQTTAIRFTVRF